MRWQPDFLILATCLAWLSVLSEPLRGGTVLPDALVQTVPDADNPRRNAVVGIGGCSGVLISADIVLTVAHCLPGAARAPAPAVAVPRKCDGLSQQAEMRKASWEQARNWYPVADAYQLNVRIGASSITPRATAPVSAYSMPPCSDLALLRLHTPLPKWLAQPMPVLTGPILTNTRVNRLLGSARMRYAGWGMPTFKQAPSPNRQTGPVLHWALTRCHIYSLPPLRASGQRVLPGDSGSPLILSLDGTEVVAGIMAGYGYPDPATCGRPQPTPPANHGFYLPTWRSAVTGAPDSIALGDWIAHMAPKSVLEMNN